ncbi:MAG: stage II sporulation protein R [Clostridia bacterium]|nr:MAG: stage II sporulation protein R [Clostridia bacterium]
MISVLLLVVIALGSAAYLLQGEKVDQAYTPDNLIRFHVMATSDEPGEQAVKLQVRDAVMAALTPKLAHASTVEQARSIALASLPLMEKVAAQELAVSGRTYPVRAEMGYYSFPTRSYNNFTLPAGEYEAIRLVLGEGKGENWWCILFPPLCFVDVAREAEAVPAMGSHDSPGQAGAARIEVRSRLMEVFRASREYLARK